MDAIGNLAVKDLLPRRWGQVTDLAAKLFGRFEYLRLARDLEHRVSRL